MCSSDILHRALARLTPKWGDNNRVESFQLTCHRHFRHPICQKTVKVEPGEDGEQRTIRRLKMWVLHGLTLATADEHRADWVEDHWHL